MTVDEFAMRFEREVGGVTSHGLRPHRIKIRCYPEMGEARRWIEMESRLWRGKMPRLLMGLECAAGRDLPWPTATPDQDPVLPGNGSGAAVD